jgi:hypothetical protein
MVANVEVGTDNKPVDHEGRNNQIRYQKVEHSDRSKDSLKILSFAFF